jgi:hypothetical protein
MVMLFVQIAEHEWNVEMPGLQTLKNVIEPAKPAKKLKKNATREQKKKNTSLFNYFKGSKAPAVPSTIIRSELIQSHRLTPLQVIDTSPADRMWNWMGN